MSSKIRKMKRAGGLTEQMKALEKINMTVLNHVMILIMEPESDNAEKIRAYYKQKLNDLDTPTDPTTIN